MSNITHTIGSITGVSSTGFLDYLAFTVPDEATLENTVENLLGFPFKQFVMAASGRSGYRTRYEYGGIDLLTDGSNLGMGHNITLKGKACFRYQNQLKEIVAQVFAIGGHFTRCDLAIDDFQGLLEMDEIQLTVRSGLVTARFSKVKEFTEYDRKTGQTVGRGAYFGSRKSDVFLRIYDKALEQKKDHHWVRIELELKNSKADAALKLVETQDVGDAVRGVLKDRLSFREKGAGVNRSRWPVAKWWELFLDAAKKLKLTSCDSNASTQEERLKWFMSNAATFAELIQVHGPEIIKDWYLEGARRLEMREGKC